MYIKSHGKDSATEAYQEKHQKRERKSSLSMEDMVLLMLTYLHSYSTLFEIGVMFNVSESRTHRITVWVEGVLVKSGQFALPNKKVLPNETSTIEVMLVDVTEQLIKRSQKEQKESYSGKERHLIQTQVIMNAIAFNKLRRRFWMRYLDLHRYIHIPIESFFGNLHTCIFFFQLYYNPIY